MENANIPPPIQEPDSRLIDSYHTYDMQDDTFDKGELFSNFDRRKVQIYDKTCTGLPALVKIHFDLGQNCGHQN